MTPRRTAATALATLAAGSLLLASAGSASAQERPERGTGPATGMARVHEQMTAQNPGMARMHELHRQGNPGMARMHELHMQGNPGMARMHELMSDGRR